jgi:hypothetical protein
MVAGTRTAPDVIGTPTALLLSLHFIDNSDDIWSESHSIPVGTTAAAQEAYIDAVQAGSTASIYKVGRSFEFGTDALADSSNAAPSDGFAKSQSVFDSLNITMKHTTIPDMKNKIVRVPAPLAQMFVNDFVDTDPLPPNVVSDNPSNVDPVLVAILAAAVTLFGGTYSVAWARYSEKSELNEKTRL